MTTPHTKQYQEKMTNIRQMLTLLKVETGYAEDFRTREGIDSTDIAELNAILSLLTKAYGVFCADEGIMIDEAMRRAKAEASTMDNQI